ncbi:MAG: YihY/virulence factor BrkB family protein [Holophaga sp.]|nr:YihY/virulence factor BrkB family protein [Holophaga sp.]
MRLRNLKIPVRVFRLGRLLVASMKAWVRHRAPSKGAALAFYTLFSMAPILVLVVAVVGYFLGPVAVRGELFSQLQGLLGTTGARAVESIVADAHLPGTGGAATVIAGLLLGVGATSLFAELKDSLDDIWNVQTPVPTGLVAVLRSRVHSFGLVLVLAFLLLVTLVVDTGLALVARLWEGQWIQSITVISVSSQVFSFTVIFGLFAVIYKMLPEVRLSWGDVAIGALCTATLFSLGKYVIGAYLGNSGVGSTMGAAGSASALLIWVYYSAQVFFLGAEFTREYALAFGSLRSRARKVILSPKSTHLHGGGHRGA